MSVESLPRHKLFCLTLLLIPKSRGTPVGRAITMFLWDELEAARRRLLFIVERLCFSTSSGHGSRPDPLTADNIAQAIVGVKRLSRDLLDELVTKGHHITICDAHRLAITVAAMDSRFYCMTGSRESATMYYSFHIHPRRW